MTKHKKNWGNLGAHTISCVNPHDKRPTQSPRCPPPWSRLALGLTSWIVLGTALDGAQAQTPPDAGLLQQQQRDRVTPPLPEKAALPSGLTPPQALTLPPGQQVDVIRFEIEGNERFSSEVLRAALASFEGHRLGMQQLQDATVMLTEFYARAGWMARSYLPTQDITTGVVRIRIVEARLGQMRIEASGQHMSAAQARSFMERYQVPGAPIQLDRLQRGLLLLSDTPGVQSSAALSAGQHTGDSDLALQLQDSSTITGNLSLDNTGARSIGEARLSGDLSLHGILGIGDRFHSLLSHSQGSDYIQAGLSLPLPQTAWRLGLRGSAMRYRLVQSDFDALQGKGKSDTLGLSADFPVLRSRFGNVYLSLSTDRKRFHNEANGAVSSDYRSRLVSAGLIGNRFDDWLGGGASTASLMLDMGRLDLNGSPSQAADAAGPRAEGRFNKLRYSLSRLQTLNRNLTAFAQWVGQVVDRNLDSSERFYLGGAQGVRAYPSSEGGGSKAQLVNLELRMQLNEGWRATAFYDRGQATSTVQGPTPAGAPNRFRLQGLGLSLGWSGPNGLDLHATWARRLGSNPLANAQGKDQDGSLTPNRLWLQASMPFSR